MNLGEARQTRELRAQWEEERRDWEARVTALRIALAQTLGAIDAVYNCQGDASRLQLKIACAKEIGYAALASRECQLPNAPEEPIAAASSIYHLPGVSLRDLNALERHGYVLIADLLATSRALLILNVNNFGIRAIASVEQALAKLGIDWPEDPEPATPSQLAGTLDA